MAVLSPVSPFYQPTSKIMRCVALVYKSVFIVELVYAYLHLTTPLHRAGGLVGALVFVLIETFWLTITSEDADGTVTITGVSSWSLGHSSFAQFWSNVIFTPLILFAYRSLLTSAVLRILLFPINIWCLEIVEGYIIMFIFGKNIAWEYRGPDSFFHGNIKLQYAVPWVGLGVVVELAWERVFLPVMIKVDAMDWTVPVLLCAAMLTLLFSPRMGVKGVWRSLRGIKQD
jgi:hypothetical protein